MKDVKTIIFIFIVIILSVLTIGLFIQNKQLTSTIDEKRTEIKDYEKQVEELNDDLEYYEIASDSSYSNILTVKLDKVRKMIEDKESFVLLISQTYCSHCIAYKPTYNEVMSENDMLGYDLDVATLSEGDFKKFKALFEVESTPTTLVFVEGKQQEEIKIGAVTNEELTKFLKKYKIIK